MNSQHVCVWTAALVLLCAQAPLRAQESPRAEEPAAAEASQEQVRQWIAELDDDKFRVRERATQALVDAGAAAVAAVAEAASSTSAEVKSRAFFILGKWLRTEDEALSQSAKNALERLAESSDKDASQRAGELLAPPEEAAPAGGIAVGGIGQFQIQIAGGAANLAVTRKIDANGTKTTQVKKDGSEVEIVESPKEGISMSITQTVEGKKKTTQYKAKNAAELKKKHPEAYKWFKEYAENGQAQIGIGRIQVLQQAIPAIQLAPALRPVQAPQAGQEIDAAQDELDKALEELKRAGEAGIDGEKARQLAARLEAAKKSLEQARQSLGLGAAPREAPAERPEGEKSAPQEQEP